MGPLSGVPMRPLSILLSALLSPVLLSACGLTEDKFEDRFEIRYCNEYEACFDDFSCDETPLERPDVSSCTYNQEAAIACLDEDWSCITNQGVPFVQIPSACAQVYGSCTSGSTGSTPITTGTPVGTPVGTPTQ